MCCAGAEEVAVTTNLQYVRDFPVAYDILFENISDQVCAFIVQGSFPSCQTPNI